MEWWSWRFLDSWRWVIVDTPKPIRLEANGILVCGCNPRSGLPSVPWGDQNSCISGGCATVDINTFQGQIKDGRWGAVIIGVAIRGRILLWINTKKWVYTEGCHAVVEFMHRRRKQAYQLQREKGRNNDCTKKRNGTAVRATWRVKMRIKIWQFLAWKNGIELSFLNICWSIRNNIWGKL